MKFTTAMLFGVALIVGVAIGYMFNPSVDAAMSGEKPSPARGSITNAGESASLHSLRARIAELEAKLAAGNATATNAAEKVDEKAGPREGRKHMSPREWREKLKKEDPERYTQMTNGIARWRRERLERAQKKVDFLSSINTSGMSKAARKTHDDLQEAIAKREELEQKLHALEESDEEVSHETRRALFDEMRQIDQEIRELNASERENLIGEAVKGLGLQGEDLEVATETFQEIIESTEGGFGATGRPPRGEAPGGNGGPGGNGAPPPMLR